ncbi:MAG: enoyl-CoA hydratase/isomerase family protein [Sandaracinaceae bacterium]
MSSRPDMRLDHAGHCLTTRCVDGLLEVDLHAPPLNEIGLPMLSELERVAQLIGAPDPRFHAVLFHSSLEGGFSAGADLRELHEGLTSVDGDAGMGAWVDHAQRLFDSPKTAGRALVGALRGVSSGGVSAKDVTAGAARRTAKVWGVRAFLDRIHAVMNTIDMAPVPTICATHGVVFGGGFELALTCDVIVADKSSRFAFPELRLGLVPGFGGIPRLERDLGNAVVRDLILSGRSLGATRAHEVGLVAQLVARGKAPDVARRLAKQMGRFDAHTARTAKRFLKPLPAARLEEEKRVFCALMTSPVVLEALTTFVTSKDAMPYLPGRGRPAPKPAPAPRER